MKKIVIRRTGRGTRFVSRRTCSEQIVIRGTGHDTRIVSRRNGSEEIVLRRTGIGERIVSIDRRKYIKVIKLILGKISDNSLTEI